MDGTIIATLLETASVTVLFLAWKSITEGAFSIPRSMKITSQISWLREHPLILLFSSPQNLGKTNIRPVVPYPPRGTARLSSAPPFLSLPSFCANNWQIGPGSPRQPLCATSPVHTLITVLSFDLSPLACNSRHLCSLFFFAV